MKIISIINTKGGVGKTVTAVHLGAALARAGHRVLLFDIDLQHGLTTYFRVETGAVTASQVLVDGESIEDAQVALRDNLALVPATSDMEGAESELIGASGGEVRLRRAFRRFAGECASAGRELPEFVLIDCPSGWSTVTRNALLVSQAMIVPVNSEPASIHTAVATIGAVGELGEMHDHGIALLGVLLTRFRPTNLARAVAQAAQDQWGERVFRTRIRQAERVNELALSGDTTSDVSSSFGGGVAQDYALLAQEVIARGPNL